MKNALLLIAFVFAINLNSQSTWTVDKAHSKMTFTVVHLAMSEVDGVFKDYNFTITSSKEDFSDAVFEASADLTTLTTNNDKRDAHLQRDDMFDTENHPKLTFKSTAVEKVDDKNFKLTGGLTIKGVTNVVDLNLKLLGTGQHRRSQKDMAGFKVTGTINRTDFNVGGMPSLVVAHEVELTASGEFIKG